MRYEKIGFNDGDVLTADNMNHIEEGISKVFEEMEQLKENGGGGNWNAAEGEPGYIANRTHWAENGVIEILPETVLVGEGEMAITTAPSAYPCRK